MANGTPLTDPSSAVHPIGIKGCPTAAQIAASVVVAKPATPIPASIAEILHLHTDARGLEETSSKRWGGGDGFAAYPEAVDLAFGPYVRYGTIIKEYKNASMIYPPSEMVGTRRTGIRGIEGRQARTICTRHVERLNGTQRLFLKRLNRLTLCFSKQLENLEAAVAIFAASDNYCGPTRMPGKSGKKRPTAAMMAGLAGHVWSFDELFNAVLKPATQV
jgi:hypothetical protein